jgi:hypothetical protein
MSIYFGTPRFFQGDFKTLEAIKKEGLVMSEPVKIEKWGYQGNCISTLPNCDMALKVIDANSAKKSFTVISINIAGNLPLLVVGGWSLVVGPSDFRLPVSDFCFSVGR